MNSNFYILVQIAILVYGEMYNSECLQSVKHGGCSVMVCCCISVVLEIFLELNMENTVRFWTTSGFIFRQDSQFTGKRGSVTKTGGCPECRIF